MNFWFREWNRAGYWAAADKDLREPPSYVPKRYRPSWFRGFDERLANERARREPIRVLFLDIDGCMNSMTGWDEVERIRARCPNFPESVERDWGEGGYSVASPSMYFAPHAVAALNFITDVTRAQIVISSTWRTHAITPLRRWGVRGDIIGVTPYFNHPKTRGDEIEWWLHDFARTRDTRRVESFVILDDDADMNAMNDRLVQTDAYGAGLTMSHAHRAVDILVG